MAKQIKIFYSFEEQELYFLEFFARLSPSERLQSLALLQKKNIPAFNQPGVKKITIRKFF